MKVILLFRTSKKKDQLLFVSFKRKITIAMKEALSKLSEHGRHQVIHNEFAKVAATEGIGI